MFLGFFELIRFVLRCAEGTQGGGPGPYQAPVGMVVDSSPSSLPHSPYTTSVSRANVHTWRQSRWFSWVFAVDSVEVIKGADTTSSNFSFSLLRGGNQGSRGGDAGQEFFIENVLDELDFPGEFFYDDVNGQLYLWNNASSSSPPPSTGGAVATPQLPIIINATGTQERPVVGVGFLGITFRDSAPTFLDPHGTPAGGDWAINRGGALFFEGTEGIIVEGCLLTRLDGNALFMSGYNRNATVLRNEFRYLQPL